MKQQLHEPDPALSQDRRQRMYHFLRTHPIGVLATVTPERQPHAVVVYFAVNKQLEIVILTRRVTRKHENLVHNPNAMLAVFEAKTQTTVQVYGEAAEITDRYEVNGIAGEILEASLRAHSAGPLPMTKLEDAGPYVAFRIKPTQVKMAVYARPDGGLYTDLFETLEAYELSAAALDPALDAKRL